MNVCFDLPCIATGSFEVWSRKVHWSVSPLTTAANTCVDSAVSIMTVQHRFATSLPHKRLSCNAVAPAAQVPKDKSRPMRSEEDRASTSPLSFETLSATASLKSPS